MTSKFARTVLAILVFAAGTAAQQPTEDAGVRHTVESYLHGLRFNDVASLRRAFHPEAKLYFVKKDGSLGQLTQEQWYKGFEGSAGKEEKGKLEIVSIDIAGNAASVKVREEYPNSIYTDYVSLLKLGGEWMIVNKVYFAESRQAVRLSTRWNHSQGDRILSSR